MGDCNTLKAFPSPHHCDPHLAQTKCNDLFPLTIDGFLAALWRWMSGTQRHRHGSLLALNSKLEELNLQQSLSLRIQSSALILRSWESWYLRVFKILTLWWLVGKLYFCFQYISFRLSLLCEIPILIKPWRSWHLFRWEAVAAWKWICTKMNLILLGTSIVL